MIEDEIQLYKYDDTDLNSHSNINDFNKYSDKDKAMLWKDLFIRNKK